MKELTIERMGEIMGALWYLMNEGQWAAVDRIVKALDPASGPDEVTAVLRSTCQGTEHLPSWVPKTKECYKFYYRRGRTLLQGLLDEKQLDQIHLEIVLDQINSMIGDHRWGEIEVLLNTYTTKKNSHLVILGALRSTFPVRSKLHNWETKVREAHSDFIDRGLDADALLKGLL